MPFPSFELVKRQMDVLDVLPLNREERDGAVFALQSLIDGVAKRALDRMKSEGQAA